MKYDLKDIIIFTYVAKLKSFIRAAEALNISKAVASTRVGELEKAIGMTLLARTTREVNLTSDGVKFFDYCSEIIGKVERLDDFLDGYKGLSGILKIVLPPYFSRYYIAPYLKEFLGKYPDLKLDIILTENPVNIITEGYDIQVRIQIPEEEGLEVAKLLTNRKVVCASPDYIKKHGKPSVPKDLLHHNCLVFGENSVWEFECKNKKDVVRLHDVSGNIKCNNGEIIKELVLSGIGITLKSFVDIQDEIKNGKLIALLKDYKVMNKTQFYAVYPAGKYLSPKIKAFVEFFQMKGEVLRKNEVIF
jgi:DNA-binding transcriptional LysR family regulator